jgi:hypothetical protein
MLSGCSHSIINWFRLLTGVTLLGKWL